MLPTYSQLQGATSGVVTTFAPRKVRLFLANSGIGLYGGMAGSTTKDSIVAIMTQCDVNIESFFPSGLPRIAVVQLAFDQVAQYAGYVDFPSIGSLDNLVPTAVPDAAAPDGILQATILGTEIGRASCRERVCQYV